MKLIYIVNYYFFYEYNRNNKLKTYLFKTLDHNNYQIFFIK